MHVQNTNQHLTKRFMVVQWQRSFTSTSQVGQSPTENQRKKCLGVAPFLAIPIPFDRGNKRQLIPGYCPSMGVAWEQLCMWTDRRNIPGWQGRVQGWVQPVGLGFSHPLSQGRQSSPAYMTIRTKLMLIHKETRRKRIQLVLRSPWHLSTSSVSVSSVRVQSPSLLSTR